MYGSWRKPVWDPLPSEMWQKFKAAFPETPEMALQETQEIQIKIPSLTQTFGVYEQIIISLSSFW